MQLYKDLLERQVKLEDRLKAVGAKWNEYIFVDEFICDLLVDEKIRLEMDLRKTAKAIQEIEERMAI